MSEPVGFEKLSIERIGRNALAPDESARLMLAIEEGVIEPQATNYMKSLLQQGGAMVVTAVTVAASRRAPTSAPRTGSHTTRWRRSPPSRCLTVDDS